MAAKLVYIIDDDPIYQFSFKRILGLIDSELRIQKFSDGEEAITHCQKMITEEVDCPSLIFLDLNMPVMDGWDFLDEFVALEHQGTAHVSVYIVSSSVHEEDRNKAKEYSVVKDYLVKPVDRKVIEELIAK